MHTPAWFSTANAYSGIKQQCTVCSNHEYLDVFGASFPHFSFSTVCIVASSYPVSVYDIGRKLTSKKVGGGGG